MKNYWIQNKKRKQMDAVNAMLRELTDELVGNQVISESLIDHCEMVLKDALKAFNIPENVFEGDRK